MLRKTSRPGKIERPDGSRGYILLDAMVTLFIVGLTFAGLLSLTSLMIRSAGEQNRLLSELIGRNNEAAVRWFSTDAR